MKNTDFIKDTLTALKFSKFEMKSSLGVARIQTRLERLERYIQ